MTNINVENEKEEGRQKFLKIIQNMGKNNIY
jgi:hypothetical protein